MGQSMFRVRTLAALGDEGIRIPEFHGLGRKVSGLRS